MTEVRGNHIEGLDIIYRLKKTISCNNVHYMSSCKHKQVTVLLAYTGITRASLRRAFLVNEIGVRRWPMDTVRPTLKQLNKYGKSVTTKWYNLGVELLADEDVKALDEIQYNYPRDVGMCCTKMFQLWLDKQPKASWSALLQALREDHIGQDELANRIEQELKGKCVEPDKYKG